MFCKVCGNQLNKDMRCTRCFTPHSVTTNVGGRLEIKQSAQPAIIELSCCIGVDPMLREITSSDEEYRKVLHGQFAHHLAEEIVKYLEVHSVVDRSKNQQIISAHLRVVEPYFKF